MSHFAAQAMARAENAIDIDGLDGALHDYSGCLHALPFFLLEPCATPYGLCHRMLYTQLCGHDELCKQSRDLLESGWQPAMEKVVRGAQVLTPGSSHLIPREGPVRKVLQNLRQSSTTWVLFGIKEEEDTIRD